MIRNFLRATLRNLWANGLFSSINILGLAMGITCCMLMVLWVWDEVRMDAFHANGDQLFSVYKRRLVDGEMRAGHNTPGLLADEIKRIIPEIQYSSAFGDSPRLETFQAGDKILQLSGTSAGVDFFRMFSYPLLAGDADHALLGPQGMAISRKMAVIFFNSPESAMGKALRLGNERDFQVTAVFEDVPSSSSLQFDFLLNWQSQLERVDWYNLWRYSRPRTFIMLRDDADPNVVESKIRHFLDKYDPEQSRMFKLELGLQRFDKMYLYSEFSNGVPSGGRITYVKLFSIVASFILLIACINFMNLSTARGLQRAKEVGVRKVIGASRLSLIGQFGGEAMLVSFMAMMIGLAVSSALMPFFNELTRKQISVPIREPLFWVGMGGLAILTGLVAGSYPSLFLSSLRPVRILKGTFKASKGAASLRKGLVVFQFTLSIFFIAGTIIVSQQVDFLRNTDTGFDREDLIGMPMSGGLLEKYQTFKREAARLPSISHVTRVSSSPIAVIDHSYEADWTGKNHDDRIGFLHLAVGYGFCTAMKINPVMGRDFSEEFAGDSANYLVNETALKVLGYDDPIGRPFKLFPQSSMGTIIGVVPDFHFASLHSTIEPLVIRFGENISWGQILVRAQPGKSREVLFGLEKLSKQLNPQFPFTYYFIDEQYKNYYTGERVVRELTISFAMIAIAISSLGLLGLSLFTIEQRTKEIGIRKVLGASLTNLVRMLSADFLRLVMIAAVVALPLGWWLMSWWLQTFAYRINISVWVFVGASGLAIIIALLTISANALKAGMANPVKALRTE